MIRLVFIDVDGTLIGSSGSVLPAVFPAAARLRERGVRDGDRVALLAFNDPAHFELLYGCGKAGAVLVPLNFRLAATEILAILRDCEPRALVIDPAHAALAAPVLAEYRGAVLWLDIRYDNPRNKNVVGLNPKRVAELFPALVDKARRLNGQFA